jgi:hypothetical protein
MSEEVKSTLGAPTILETVRMRQMEQGLSVQDQDDGESQIKTREMNPGADSIGGPAGQPSPQPTQRRIQQPPEGEGSGEGTGEDDGGDEDAAKERREKAEEFFRRKLFGDKHYESRKAKETKSEEGAGEEGGGDPDAVKDGDGATPETAPKSPKVTRRQPSGISQIDAESIATAAATAAVRAIKDPMSSDDKTVADKAPSDLDELDQRDKLTVQIARKMAENDPRYSDLPDKMIHTARLKKEYRQEWEKENKGKRFSWDDDEHASFLNESVPEFDPHDYDEARIDLRVEAKTRSIEDRNDARLREIEARSFEGTVNEKAAKETAEGSKFLAKEFGEDVDWDLSTEAGRKKIAEGEPVVGEIVVSHARFLDDANKELVKIFDAKDRDGKGLYTFDPKANPTHRWIQTVVDKWEKTFSTLPPEKTENDAGQTFVPRSKFLRMTPDQQANHWSIFRDQTFYIVAQEVAKSAADAKKKTVEQLKSLAKRNNWAFAEDSIVSLKKPGKPAATQRQQPTKTVQNPSKGDGFGKSPSAAGGGRIDPSASSGVPDNKQFIDKLMSKMFPRSKD